MGRTGPDISLDLTTEEGNKNLYKKALTIVSHASLAVSLVMLCQSSLGTRLTLRCFWQSDYESLCSSVVGAVKWTKSSTAVRTWLAVMLPDEEWAAYIKAVSSLLTDPLSASWQCQDGIRPMRGRHWRRACIPQFHGALPCRVASVMVCFPRLMLAIPQSQLFSFECWPDGLSCVIWSVLKLRSNFVF